MSEIPLTRNGYATGALVEPDVEVKHRLRKRPEWFPATYEGICEECGEPVRVGDPITLVKKQHGARWTCACIFMPGLTDRERMACLRRMDDLITLISTPAPDAESGAVSTS